MAQEKAKALTEFLADPEAVEALEQNFSDYQPTNPEIIAEMERLNRPPDPAILDRPIAPH